MNKTEVVEKKYLLPFIQITSLFALWGFVNDIMGQIGSFDAVNLSFILPLISFVVIAIYGYRTYRFQKYIA